MLNSDLYKHKNISSFNLSICDQSKDYIIYKHPHITRSILRLQMFLSWPVSIETENTLKRPVKFQHYDVTYRFTWFRYNKKQYSLLWHIYQASSRPRNDQLQFEKKNIECTKLQYKKHF